jgi:hypothetical protein
MAYNIQKTDDTILVTVNDTELNTDYGITLVGRNYSGYGVYLNDNFVALMENFANSSPPVRPLAGQLWFDTVNKTINLYQGNGFKPLASLTASLVEPLAGPRAVGDLWWDLDDLQLKAFTSSSIAHVSTMTISNTNEIRIDNTSDLQIGDIATSAGGNITLATGSRVEQIVSATNVRITNAATLTTGEAVTFFRGTGWNVIGPAYSVKQGVTGWVGRNIIDTNTVNHVIAIGYVKDQPVAIMSRDAEFTPRSEDSIVGWSTIKPGMNLKAGSQTQNNKTITAFTSGGASGTVLPLSSVTELQVGDVFISANVNASAGITLQNIFFANTSVLVDVNDIFSPDEVVSFQRGSAINYLYVGTATNSQLLDNISPDRWARRDIDVSFAGNITTQGNLYFNSLKIDDRGGAVDITNDVFAANVKFWGNVSGIGYSEIMNISGETGRVRVTTGPESDMDVVTKAYSDTQLVQSSDWIAANVATLIGGTAPAEVQTFSGVSALANTIIQTANVLTTDVALKAYINSPALTGVPTAPTAALTTRSTQIATTEFVDDTVATLRNQVEANATVQAEQIDLRATIDSPIFTGTPRSVDPLDTDQSTAIATTRFVSNIVSILRNFTVNELALKAPLASPALTGIPTAPNAAVGTNSAQIATTNFVNVSIAALETTQNANASVQYGQIFLRANINSPTFTGIPRVSSNPSDADNSTRIASTFFVQNNLAGLRNYTDNALGLKAPLASPELTGVPIAPTAPLGDASTRIATTAFVQAGLNLKASLAGASFTGNVFVPTPLSPTDSSTRIPNTSWVRTWVTTYGSSKEWDGARKYVSTQEPDPGVGSAGDFWFQFTP